MVTFQLHQQDVAGDHRFSVYDCQTASGTTLVEELADRVRDLYADPNELRDALEQGATGLDGIADVPALKALVEQVTKAVIPVPAANPTQPRHLDLARNEVAEVIAYEAVEGIYSAVIPAARIREKEVPGQPTRGLDLLALILEPVLRLLVAEVKASSSPSSPPPVVGRGEDSLHSQTHGLVTNSDRLLRELTWSLKHCHNETLRAALGRAMLQLALHQLPIVAVPVLVRPVNRHGANDFGRFRDDPDQYSPATVDFCVARVDGTLEQLAGDVYVRARQVP